MCRNLGDKAVAICTALAAEVAIGLLECVRGRDQSGILRVAGEVDVARGIDSKSGRRIVLLCYKCGRRQQGHLGSERAKWVAIWRRRVAME